MGEPTPRSADQLTAATALACYDLPQSARLRPIRTTNNAVFEVAVDGPGDRPHRYVLRVHRPRHRTAEQIRSELYLLRPLPDELPGDGFSVPQPVPARDGALVVEVAHREVVRHCDLLTSTCPTGTPRRCSARPATSRPSRWKA